MMTGIVETMENQSDEQVWNTCILFVAIAGQRAARIQREDVNTACKAFIDVMHDMVGTPEGPA